MGSTLATLRTTKLNVDLGLADDDDDRFGTDEERNRFLISAYERLWPVMGRLITEEVEIEAGVREYELEAIEDINIIELLNPDAGLNYAGRISAWRLIPDETSDPPLLRLSVPSGLRTGWTMRITGYAPFSIPSTGTTTSELAARLEFIVVTGARAEAYRWRLNRFVDYDQQAVASPVTAISAGELRDLYLAAKSEFEQLVYAHRRSMASPRRGRQKVS